MKIHHALLAFLTFTSVTACAPSGPIKFYDNAALTQKDLAIVVIPGPITMHSIDGKVVKSPSSETQSYEVHLPPGHHYLVFKYELFWGDMTAGLLIKSKLTGVDTDFVAGRTYDLKYKIPSTESEAFQFTKEFNVTLVDRTSDQQVSSYRIDDIDGFIKSKMASTAAPAATPAVKQNAVKQLEYWWLLANAEERQEFTSWMKTATETFTPPQDAEAAVKGDTVKQLKYWWLTADATQRKDFTDWLKSNATTAPSAQGKPPVASE